MGDGSCTDLLLELISAVCQRWVMIKEASGRNGARRAMAMKEINVGTAIGSASSDTWWIKVQTICLKENIEFYNQIILVQCAIDASWIRKGTVMSKVSWKWKRSFQSLQCCRWDMHGHLSGSTVSQQEAHQSVGQGETPRHPILKILAEIRCVNTGNISSKCDRIIWLFASRTCFMHCYAVFNFILQLTGSS